MPIAKPLSGWRLERNPTTPGEVLLEEYLLPLGLSQHALAMALAVPATRVAEIVHGRRSVTPDTALRLAHVLGTSPEFWLNLQQACDLYALRSAYSGPRPTQTASQPTAVLRPFTPPALTEARVRARASKTASPSRVVAARREPAIRRAH